ncbi:hypothetical protein [Burkholderia gladioli]|uniref:hypothetical protein n=1 Tax=Burkholderia gladioli TaxID=28095 RepID=UPI001C22F75D|nr:hypothetical protein [Burkholderia gladioli]MBU9168556.1 hypothetical protein [Burkholderia gladioli]
MHSSRKAFGVLVFLLGAAALSGCAIVRPTPAQIAAQQAQLEQQLAPMQKKFDTLNANEKQWEASHPKEAAERRRLIQQEQNDYDSNAAYDQRQQMIRESQRPKQQNLCSRPVGSGPDGLIMGMVPCD